jgi:AtzE family amidohydrolase
MLPADASALAIAAEVRAGRTSARAVAEAALARIAHDDPKFNSFTDVTHERALREADAVDALVARGEDPGALAGVPFAAKNLFDIAGLVTRAGSKINRDHAPAATDATLIKRLNAAGAVLVGALNMDEYAYGFTTENTHDGAVHNPHDLARIAGGSSGGSGAALAGGLVPLTLGTDTNGSIRVPASLCGVFGLKPTYGRLSRHGAAPFVASLDHVGPLARTVDDLAAAYDAAQGYDPRDPVCAKRAPEPALPLLHSEFDGLRVGVLDDYFEQNAEAEAHSAVSAVAHAANAVGRMRIAEAQRARAAAFVITSSEGGSLHLPDLRSRAADFDPMTRDRFLAGALVPAAWYHQAQRFRSWYRVQVLQLFNHVDILLAPATPSSATPIGQDLMTIAGQKVPTRPSMGLLTQPISFIGLPVVVVPLHRAGHMPIGVQLIAAPWQEAKALRLAAMLEQSGVASAPVAASAIAAAT